MSRLTYPVAIWKDAADQHTAVVLDYGDGRGTLSAVDTKPADALEQIKQYLEWQRRRGADLSEPDFSDPQVLSIGVDVRPAYRTETRTWNLPQTMRVSVPAVIASRRIGGLAVVLPTFGDSFDCEQMADVKNLVTQHVQQVLGGSEPQEIGRWQPPESMWIESVSVRRPREARGRAHAGTGQLKLPALESAAERLLLSTGGAGGRAWQRDREVEDLVTRLAEGRGSILLIGESGVGKTTLLRDAAQRLDRLRPAAGPGSSGEARHRARDRYWLTSAARIISGMKYLGQWQERCEQMLDELKRIDGVLCIENLLELVRTGGTSAVDSIAAFLTPYIERGELRLVSEATPAELDALRRLLPACAQAMTLLKLEPFDRAATVRILDGIGSTLAQNQRVELEPGVSDAVYRLFNRFMPYHSFPGRAGRFIKRLAESVRRRGDRRITLDDVIGEFLSLTGLPEVLLRDELPLSRTQVLADLKAQIIGQDHACEAAADVMVTFKAALNDPARPIGVMLFGGPTGVGKTELAKAISRYLFGAAPSAGKDRLIRLDMSEYAGSNAARRLIGDPHGEPGEIIRRVRQQPLAVLLLDEIEKADPEVFDILLGLLDEGRLVDQFGRVTSFRSTIIIMTSNLGGQMLEPFGFADQPSTSAASEVRRFFRPEFFNRIDAVVEFHPLGRESVRVIAEQQLQRLAMREGLAAAGIMLSWTGRLLDHLIAHGFDARYGARPMQRVIETTVVAPLGRLLVERPASRGPLHMDITDGRLSILDIGLAHPPAAP